MDDVDTETKKRRADELVEVFREEAFIFHQRFVGTKQLVLVEGVSSKSWN